jgi:predicted kinase
MERPMLIVVTGRPGTGKTTLSRSLARRMDAVYLRIDAIETALQVARADPGPVGPEGYAVAHLIARTNLELGSTVVIDAVCPVPESRRPWFDTAADAGSDVIIFETSLPDPVEHERRVVGRRPDMPGQRVPSWTEVSDGRFTPWDEDRDGPRTIIDTTDAGDAVHRAVELITTADPRR